LPYINKFIIYYFMKTGLVKFFNEAKGFGFIKMDDSGDEIFVHVSGLTEKIKQDDRVSFDVTEGKKGPNAINVKKI
jgi:cold shock protein